MCAHIVDCHAAYKTYSAYSNLHQAVPQDDILQQKADSAVIENEFEADKSEKNPASGAKYFASSLAKIF